MLGELDKPICGDKLDEPICNGELEGPICDGNLTSQSALANSTSRSSHSVDGELEPIFISHLQLRCFHIA